MAPFITNDTSNIKLSVMIIENESRRLMISFSHAQPLRGRAFNFQMWLMESCISPKTLVAPIINEASPIIVAKIGGGSLVALCIVAGYLKPHHDQQNLYLPVH